MGEREGPELFHGHATNDFPTRSHLLQILLSLNSVKDSDLMNESLEDIHDTTISGL